MVERSILFARPLVQALLAGRKTQTRRPILPQPDKFKKSSSTGWRVAARGQELRCPFGVPGDRLWVREKWGYEGQFFDRRAKAEGPFVYAADGPPHGSKFIPWKPSLHMPRQACRLVLEITSTQAQRVQELTVADGLAEGYAGDHLDGPIGWFSRVWDQYYASRGIGWASNPWVWVVGFRVVSGLPNDERESGEASQAMALRNELVDRLRECVRNAPDK